MDQLTKPKSVTGWAAWLVGGLLGYYAGIQLLLPLLLTFAAGWGLKKTKWQAGPYVPAAAVQSGHMLWLSVGLLVTGINANVWDSVILVVGVLWLLARPSLAPLIFLSLYQVLSLAVNLYMFSEVQLGSVAAKALPVHIVWRGLALFLMWRGFLTARKPLAAIEDTAPANPPVQ